MITLTEQRDALIQYLKVKVETADWHGVSDAANDLRVLEERIQCNVRWEDRSNG
jgi:hypothetical protein